MDSTRTYISDDGREWMVTLEAPGRVLRVPASLEKSGANLPEHQIQIVFTSGDDRLAEEYTGLAPLSDMSDEDLSEWFDAARKGDGI